MRNRDTRIKANIDKILEKDKKPSQIPSVFLLALRDYDEGFRQLKRRVFFEMPKLKTRWGFFVLLLLLAHDKTGLLKISWKDLVAITGLARENVYKILKYLQRLNYISYLPAKNKYRSQIFIQVKDTPKYIFKKTNSSDNSSLQNGNCRDKTSLQGSVSLNNPNGYRGLNNNCLNKTTTNHVVVDAKILERQKTLLECNEVYREDIIQKIQSLFKEKTKTEIPREVILGKPNSLLERFLLENVILNVQRIHWSAKIDNPIGYLIKSLEDGYILPESQEEKLEKEKERREKEEADFRKKIEEQEKEAKVADYSLIRPLIEKCKMTLGMIKVGT